MDKKTFSGGWPTPDGTIRFHTTYFTSVAPHGSGVTGYCDLHFFTPEGQPNYVTVFSPEGLQQLTQMLMTVLSAQPKATHLQWVVPSGRLQGKITYGPGVGTYFGQNYRLDVIQALGVLMIRANIIDHGLIALSSSLTGMNHAQAAAQFYASTNMKAKLDAIRSVADASGLESTIIEQISKALNKVKRAADRRNDIVHGEWLFRREKHRVKLVKPRSKKKVVELTITENFILDIAEAYSIANSMLLVCLSSIKRSANATSSTARTPSSGEPDN